MLINRESSGKMHPGHSMEHLINLDIWLELLMVAKSYPASSKSSLASIMGVSPAPPPHPPNIYLTLPPFLPLSDIDSISEPIQAEQYLVVADYKKQQKNEVDLVMGDLVEVFEKNDNGESKVSSFTLERKLLFQEG